MTPLRSKSLVRMPDAEFKAILHVYALNALSTLREPFPSLFSTPATDGLWVIAGQFFALCQARV